MLGIDHQHEERGAAEPGTEARRRREAYDWVTQTLVEHEYSGQPREAKGVLRAYLGKMTGLSRAQVTRLIGRYHESVRAENLLPEDQAGEGEHW